MNTARVLQSALDPAGPQARHIAQLWWVMFWVCTAVFVIVMAFVAGAIIRSFRARRLAGTGATLGDRVDASRDLEERARPVLIVAVSAGVATTVVIMFGFLVYSVWTGRAIASLGASSAVTIDLTGHQWWWEVEYEDAVPSRRARTANELHIPVGRPVVLKVTSHDVIHSFWVPNLHGKRDLIPGYTTAIWIQADRAGVYRGQCAEFCGLEHAAMAMYVTAESDHDFENWLDGQREPSIEPATADEQRGRDVFLASTCPQCHTVRGTIAGATYGPDLTHVAARSSLAAGTLPNTTGHLAGWILDSQTLKPGNHMPPNAVPGEDFQPLLAYLRSLK